METLVFATSVKSSHEVKSLTPLINSLVGDGQWNFALDDSDGILRIVSNKVQPMNAISLLNEHGFECKELQ